MGCSNTKNVCCETSHNELNLIKYCKMLPDELRYIIYKKYLVYRTIFNNCENNRHVFKVHKNIDYTGKNYEFPCKFNCGSKVILKLLPSDDKLDKINNPKYIPVFRYKLMFKYNDIVEYYELCCYGEGKRDHCLFNVPRNSYLGMNDYNISYGTKYPIFGLGYIRDFIITYGGKFPAHLNDYYKTDEIEEMMKRKHGIQHKF